MSSEIEIGNNNECSLARLSEVRADHHLFTTA